MNNPDDKCYMCDENAVSREHIPPRCLFPKSKDLKQGLNLRKELLTVPSCDVHNSEKSGEDLYFLNVMTSIKGINEIGRQHYKKKIRRQNKRNSSIISRFAQRSIEIDGNLAFEVEIERLDEFILCLGCALYLAYFKTKWDGNVEWFPEFLFQCQDQNEEQERIQIIREVDSQFSEIPVHGENKEVFSYQVIEDSFVTKMRLYIYGNCKIILIFAKHQS